jgi:uncharacterized membrane protein
MGGLIENVTELVFAIVTGIWITGLVTSQSWWMMALFLGYFVAVPTASYLNSKSLPPLQKLTQPVKAQNKSTSDTESPLEDLRRRYAQGELTDDEFEQKVENLIGTESIEVNTQQQAEQNHTETLKNK